MKTLEEMPGTLEYALRRERRAERERLKKAEAEKLRRVKCEAKEAKKRTRKALKEKIIEPLGVEFGSSLHPARLLIGRPTTKPRLDDIEQYQH